MEIFKQQSEIKMRHRPVISICGYVGGRQFKQGVRVQSIGIDETNTFQGQSIGIDRTLHFS